MDANDTAQLRLSLLLRNRAAAQERRLEAVGNDAREVRMIAYNLLGLIAGVAEAMRDDALLHQPIAELGQA